MITKIISALTALIVSISGGAIGSTEAEAAPQTQTGSAAYEPSVTYNFDNGPAAHAVLDNYKFVGNAKSSYDKLKWDKIETVTEENLEGGLERVTLTHQNGSTHVIFFEGANGVLDEAAEVI